MSLWGQKCLRGFFPLVPSFPCSLGGAFRVDATSCLSGLGADRAGTSLQDAFQTLVLTPRRNALLLLWHCNRDFSTNLGTLCQSVLRWHFKIALFSMRLIQFDYKMKTLPIPNFHTISHSASDNNFTKTNWKLYVNSGFASFSTVSLGWGCLYGHHSKRPAAWVFVVGFLSFLFFSSPATSVSSLLVRLP